MRSLKPLTAVLLGLAVVALFVVSFVFAPRGEEEAFAGTDSIVTGILEEQGVEPWFEPLFTPESGEIESGLFAMQAALGAGVLGYALGNLRGRSAQRREDALAPTPPSEHPAA